MPLSKLDPLDRRLLDGFQRDFPLVARPFAAIAASLGVGESDVLDRLRRLAGTGAVSRVGAVCRPNAVGASTLAAIAAPDEAVEEVAAIIGEEPGVNHSYLRENPLNLWFVATGPDRAHVDAALARIAARTGLDVVDLPLVRSYHIDLGFSLNGATPKGPPPPAPDTGSIRPGDMALIQALTDGMPLTPRPFGALGLPEAQAITRIGALTAAGILARVGVIVRHRALGWRANAMVCFAAPESRIDTMGVALAAAQGVTLCYRRRPDPRRWPFPLFCMIHATSREAAMEHLGAAAARAGLGGIERRILFSQRCFRQRGALVTDRSAA